MIHVWIIFDDVDFAMIARNVTLTVLVNSEGTALT